MTIEAKHAPVRDWLKIALWLVVCTLAYHFIEAIISIGAGLLADSIALIGFGLDSIIESAAAGLLLWRLRVEDRGAQDKIVAQSIGYFVLWV